MRNLPCETLNENGDPIMRDEFNRAQTQLRKGKSVGDNSVPIKLYEAAGPPFWEEFLELFNNAYNTETIPNDWQKGIISPYGIRETKQIVEITE